MNVHFGTVLKDWRTRRRMSQLDLGLSANVSARHISFLETGRSRPSRSMVLMLCEELDIPRHERNQMLMAAGLAPAYQVRDRDDGDLAPAMQALDWMLERHDPYPAIAMDKHWKLLKLNKAAQMMLTTLGLNEGESLLDAFLTSDVLKEAVENYEEVASHLRQRLKTELVHFGADPVLENAILALDKFCNPPNLADGILPVFIPARYRFQGASLAFFSTFSQFGTVEDIALAEVKIELMFPADDQTRRLLEAMGGA